MQKMTNLILGLLLSAPSTFAQTAQIVRPGEKPLAFQKISQSFSLPSDSEDAEADFRQDEPDYTELLDAAELRASQAGALVLSTGRSMVAQGTVVVGSCWDYIDAVFKNAGFKTAKLQTTYHAQKPGPYVSVDLIQPGDWLYYVNHSYGDVEHSGIFIDWTDFESKQALILSYAGGNHQTPGRYRVYDLSSVYNIMRANP